MTAYAVLPVDDEFKAKQAAYLACVAANVSIPIELSEFFDGEPPDPSGRIVRLNGGQESLRALDDHDQTGFEMDVTRLPPVTRLVRFVCRW